MESSTSPLNPDHPLDDQDVRAIVRLLSDVAAESGAVNRKREILMEGLCRLIDAQAWLWAAAPSLVPGQQPVYFYHQLGGLQPEQLPAYLKAVEHPDTGEMTLPFAQELQKEGTHLTRLRQQIIPDARFLSSPANKLWREAGLGPLILSFRPLEKGAMSSVGIYRHLDKLPFTQRESKIVHILLTEVDWLHMDGLPVEESRSLPALSPRCRMVFTQLLHGRSRKQIAADLVLSVHTVNDYVKTLFSHFGVRSTPELLARFRVGDGRDTP
ncbi:MAG: helix-turn-helix transcriptional regulator [Luteolibacter sp.]